MSESQTFCPICNRPPGGVHEVDCPRSRERQRQLAFECRRALRRQRLVWTKGPIAYRLPGQDAQLTYNPGIPYVGPGKSWRAGGVPLDTSAVDEFLKSMGVKK